VRIQQEYHRVGFLVSHSDARIPHGVCYGVSAMPKTLLNRSDIEEMVMNELRRFALCNNVQNVVTASSAFAASTTRDKGPSIHGHHGGHVFLPKCDVCDKVRLISAAARAALHTK
jgi:hypothetical protein